MDPHQHVKVALKLNPNQQLWMWSGSYWERVNWIPQWGGEYYALTPDRKTFPNWTPNDGSAPTLESSSEAKS